jgi:glycosyltransferase involved in cell wall biosynthesis
LNEKLKILFISSWYPHKLKPLNGIFIKRHAAANTIDCRVSAIFICSADINSIEESMEDGIYTIRGYYTSPKLKLFPFYSIAKLIKYLSTWKKVLAVYKAKQGKPDIINSNIVYPVSIIARCIKIFWKVPYVITEHWTGYFPEDGHYKGLAKKLVTKIAVANAGAVITDSAKLGRTMTSLGLKNKYFTIPNVVDPQIFTIDTHKPSAEYFNFIHVSSLDDEQKNISGMLRAFKKFHAIHPSSKFTIIWNEEEKENLEKLKGLLGDNTGVSIIGKKVGTELAEQLNKANAFLLFSNYENLPCVMLEAFMCGIPVIGTNVGDVPDFINAKNGVLIDSKNEELLVHAMEAVYRNMATYNPTEIRNMVLDKVSPAAVSKQFTDIYKMVLTKN